MQGAASVRTERTSDLAAPSPKPLPQFDEFSARFVMEAENSKSLSADSDYMLRALAYAKPLVDAGLPVIFSRDHLCALVGYSQNFVDGATGSPFLFYRKFKIAKRNGGIREIAEPLPSLMEIQRWIYQNVLRRVPVSPAAKAFVPGKTLKDSARFHLGQKFVLRMDIRNFFPSISRRRVFGLFRSLGYASAVSEVMSRLCCLDDVLPQGGVCSPYISNLIVRRLDSRLLAFCKRKRLRYTRYADDFSVSGEVFSHAVVEFIAKVVHEEGFRINDDKTMIMRNGGRQTVVGIVVNERQSAPREFRRKLRQHAYFIQRHGLDDHLAKLGENRSGAREHYLGNAAFVLMLNPEDRDANKVCTLLK